MTTLQMLTQLLYLIVFVALLREFRRRPNRASLDAMLFFAAIALLVALGAFRSLAGATLPAFVTSLTVPIAVALPYLLLRLVDDYSGVRWIVLRIAEAGLALAVAALLLATRPFPAAVTLTVAAYFVALLAYCAVAFYRGTRDAGGLTGFRMRAIAAGTALLALTIAASAGAAFEAGVKDAAAALGQLAALGSAVAYYFGFAPPGLLRRLWHEPQLRAFLQTSAKLDAGQRIDELLAQLAAAMASGMGAASARGAVWDGSTETFRSTIDGETVVTSARGTLDGRAVAERKPMMSDNIQRDYPAATDLYAPLGIRALLAAPIIIQDRPFAVVSVGFPRASLFVRDDLDFLGLLANHAAIVVENAQLLAELRDLRDQERLRGQRAMARLASIVESSVDAILGETPEGVITDWNPAAERLYGYAAAEVIGQRVNILVPPDRQGEISALLERASRGESITGYETVRLRRDGSAVDVSLSVSPTKDDAGRITGIAVIARDVTESKANAARFRGMVDAALDALVGIDEAGNVVEWSRQAEVTFGWTREEVMGRPLASLIVPERYRAAHLAGLEHFRRTREGPVLRKRLELEARARDGREFPVELTITPVVTRDGHVFSAFVRDITERRHQERALKALHDVAFTAGHTLDPQRLAEFTVDQARRVLGIQTAALYLWDETERVLKLAARSHTGDQPAAPQIRPGEGLSGIAYQRREPVVVPDYASWPHRIVGPGASIDCGMAVPLLVGDRVVGTLLVSSYLPHAFAPTDLQFLTLFASEVAPALEASRLLVVEQRQKVVEEASRAKSTFLASMSHELRTPLNAILGFTDLLEEQLGGTLSERQRTFVAHIRDAGQHLLALINDVLDLTKVESGRLELRPERVPLSSLVAPVTASAETDAAARGVLWRQDPLPDVQLMLDVGRIRQVLYNLLSNAMKFTPTGGTVSLRAVVEDATLRFEVRDSGIGIPAAQHHRVFGTFERLHEGSHTAGGTGLGLALTKQLVEFHGGSIAFESVEGQGTCFTVALPGVVAPTITGARVLVVENDPGDAALVAALAAEAEVQTEVVATVDEALNALARERPLGVVLDLRLPGARGEMLFEAMQRDPVTARIPVVVITVEEADRRNTTRLIGIDDYLTKPIDAARLGSWFKRVAQRGQ